jgi:hypothetical protein
MGAIRRTRNGTIVYLPAQLLLGRSDGCGLILDVSSVSSNHALIHWRDGRWLVRDLESRNGTYLNGQRVQRGTGHQGELSRGDELAFSERDEIWTLIDDSPPGPLLIPEDGSSPIPLRHGELLAWPAEDAAVGYVYCEGMTWKLEDSKGRVQPLESQQVVHVGGSTFRLHLPTPSPETPLAVVPVTERSFDLVSLDICVAADEETAAVLAEVPGDTLALHSRAHLYLLAHLARHRLEQTQAPRNMNLDGWVGVDEACRDLAIPTAEALAVTVYRCRKDFERLGFREPSRLIDRTKRGFLRIGVPADRLRVRHD